MMFITPEELAELTGYRRNADQRRWLKSHGWKFVESANGKPIVARKHAEAMLCIEPANKEWVPNRSIFAKKAA